MKSMKTIMAIALVFALSDAVFAQSNVTTPPSEDAARKAFAAVIDDGKTDILAIGSFQKIDAQKATGADGITRYSMFVDANVMLLQNAKITTGISVGAAQAMDAVQVVRGSDSENMGQFGDIMDASSGIRALCEKDALKLSGTMEWALYESGWRYSGAKLKAKIVSGGVNCRDATSASQSSASASSAPRQLSQIDHTLLDAVQADYDCPNASQISGVKLVGSGAYGATGRGHSTYEYAVVMSCLPDSPTHQYKARVDESGRLRFVVRTNPPQ